MFWIYMQEKSIKLTLHTGIVGRFSNYYAYITLNYTPGFGLTIYMLYIKFSKIYGDKYFFR